MIGLALARRLRAAGLAWNPLPGDRFVVPDRGMDDEVFVVSNMVIEVQDAPGGQVIGFNGTTEWALDSLEQSQVVWMPRETQLRELLADRFVRLEAVTGGFAVVFADSDVSSDVGSAGGADAGSTGGANAGADVGSAGGADAGSAGGADAGSAGGADGGSDAGSTGGANAGEDVGSAGGADGGSDAGADVVSAPAVIQERREVDGDAESAYARALLAVLER